MSIKALLSTTIGIAFGILGISVYAAENVISEGFDFPDSGWIDSKVMPLAERFTILRGRLKIEDGMVMSPDVEIGERNEVLFDEMEIPDAPNQAYSVSLDFKLPVLTQDGAISLLLNHRDTQNFVCFRLRLGAQGRHASQIIIMKDSQAQPGSGDILNVQLFPDVWYRIKISSPLAGEFSYEILEVDGDRQVASGTLFDSDQSAGVLTGGKVGFGASGPGTCLDNFQFTIGN